MQVSGLLKIAAAVVVVATLSLPAKAQDDVVLEPVLIELPSLLAPIFSNNGRVRTYLNLAIKIELHPETGLTDKDVKSYISRFQDVVVRHMYRRPIPRHPDGDGYWLEEVGKRLTPELEALFQRVILAPPEEDAEEPNPAVVKGVIIDLF